MKKNSQKFFKKNYIENYGVANGVTYCYDVYIYIFLYFIPAQYIGTHNTLL